MSSLLVTRRSGRCAVSFLQRATWNLGNPLRFMSTDEVVSVVLNLMEDVSGEELFENPVILSVTSLVGRWVVLAQEWGVVLTM